MELDSATATERNSATTTEGSLVSDDVEGLSVGSIPLQIYEPHLPIHQPSNNRVVRAPKLGQRICGFQGSKDFPPGSRTQSKVIEELQQHPDVNHRLRRPKALRHCTLGRRSATPRLETVKENDQHHGLIIDIREECSRACEQSNTGNGKDDPRVMSSCSFASGTPRFQNVKAPEVPSPGHYEVDLLTSASKPHARVFKSTADRWAGVQVDVPGPGAYNITLAATSKSCATTTMHGGPARGSNHDKSLSISFCKELAFESPSLEILPCGYQCKEIKSNPPRDCCTRSCETERSRVHHDCVAATRMQARHFSETPTDVSMCIGNAPLPMNKGHLARAAIPMSSFASTSCRDFVSSVGGAGLNNHPGPGHYNSQDSTFKATVWDGSIDPWFCSSSSRHAADTVSTTGPNVGPGSYNLDSVKPPKDLLSSTFGKCAKTGDDWLRQAAESPGPAAYDQVTQRPHTSMGLVPPGVGFGCGSACRSSVESGSSREVKGDTVRIGSEQYKRRLTMVHGGVGAPMIPSDSPVQPWDEVRHSRKHPLNEAFLSTKPRFDDSGASAGSTSSTPGPGAYYPHAADVPSKPVHRFGRDSPRWSSSRALVMRTPTPLFSGFVGTPAPFSQSELVPSSQSELMVDLKSMSLHSELLADVREELYKFPC